MAGSDDLKEFFGKTWDTLSGVFIDYQQKGYERGYSEGFIEAYNETLHELHDLDNEMKNSNDEKSLLPEIGSLIKDKDQSYDADIDMENNEDYIRGYVTGKKEAQISAQSYANVVYDQAKRAVYKQAEFEREQARIRQQKQAGFEIGE